MTLTVCSALTFSPCAYSSSPHSACSWRCSWTSTYIVPPPFHTKNIHLWIASKTSFSKKLQKVMMISANVHQLWPLIQSALVTKATCCTYSDQSMILRSAGLPSRHLFLNSWQLWLLGHFHTTSVLAFSRVCIYVGSFFHLLQPWFSWDPGKSSARNVSYVHYSSFIS